MELRLDDDRVVIALEHAGDEEARPGLLLIASGDDGQVSAVLEREDVGQLHEFLDDWLVETEPEPEIPGRPM
jgi:hypothetical protein